MGLQESNKVETHGDGHLGRGDTVVRKCGWRACGCGEEAWLEPSQRCYRCEHTAAREALKKI